MEYIDPLYKDIAEVLSDIYRKVNWKNFTNKKKDAATSFSERLMVAGHMSTVPRALHQLAISLDLGGYVTDPDKVVSLEKSADIVLDRMAKESSLLALQAQVEAKAWFAAHRKLGDDSA